MYAKKILGPLALLVLFVASFCAESAEQIEPGTRITKSNIDSLINQNYEGKVLGDMMPQSMQNMVKDGLNIDLVPHQPVPMDPKWLAATEKYRGTTKYDPATRLVSNYTAGNPFPDVQNDALGVTGGDSELAATKLMWNFFYASPLVPDTYEVEAEIALIDRKNGVEQSQSMADNKFRMVGRINGGPDNFGDGIYYKRQMTYITEPYDLAGVGSFFLRYTDGRPDDAWAYVKSIRRIRRISGNTWMDPLANTDMLADDNALFDAFPTWWPKYDLVGEQWLLARVHAENLDAQFEEVVDVKNPPYWYPRGKWEPRQVYVIEATAPRFHPYSKKIMYMEKEYPVMYYGEAYDKKDQLWKVLEIGGTPITNPDGSLSISVAGGIYLIVDVLKDHATVVRVGGQTNNRADAVESQFTPEKLKFGRR